MKKNYVKNEDTTVTLTITKEEFEDHFCSCADCGELIFKSEAVCIDEEYYCSDCTTTCDICGAVMPLSKAHRTVDSDYDYCEHCYSHETYRCEDCEDRYRYNDELHELNGHWYCEGCYENHYPIIQSYHTMKDSGDIDFYGDEDRKSSPYMGFELEVDSNEYFNREEIASGLKNRFGSFFHFENDGSLAHGFEIISQPSSLNYHLGMMPKYADAFIYMLDNGVKSHNAKTCGFHIHIDREYFGSKEDCAIAKLLYIFEKFRPELMRFSRRTESQSSDWCRSRKTQYNAKSPWIKRAIKDSKEYSNYQDRYFAVNLTNSNTIEIRLWRGTLNAETFEATLKFTARLAELCKSTPAVKLSKMTFEELLGSDEVILSYWDRIDF